MDTIVLKTEIPGPKSRALVERRQRVVAPGIATFAPIFVEKASGAHVTDVDGNVFLDFAGGIGVLNVGHAHPQVVKAVASQAEQITHMAFQVAGYESYVEVCERLCALTPGTFAKKALLVSTGAEAVENAIKIARVATGRPAVVAFTHAFHGRTLLGMSLTGKVSPYKVGFGPFAPEVYRLPFPYCYRCSTPQQPCCLANPQKLTDSFKTLVAPESVAAVILEPVLGEGGFVPAPKEFLATLRRFCSEHGIVLIADEIQTGFGRCGRMFACEVLDLEPDIITVAKSLAGGLPLAGLVGRAEIIDKVPPGGLGGTYAGNPIATAAALASLDVLQNDNLAGRAELLGNRVRARFSELATKSPHIGDVRGLGLMIGLELIENKNTRTPASKLTAAVQKSALQRGLIVLSAGTAGNVLRLLVPLVITDQQLDMGLDILCNAVLEAGKNA